MTEPKKIRFTKDGFFGIKEGDEFEVKGVFIEKKCKGGGTQIPLSVMEGFYKVVRFKPREKEAYRYVNSDLTITTVYEAGRTDDDLLYVNRLSLVGNCFPCTVEGIEQAEAKADQIRAIFKVGV